MLGDDFRSTVNALMQRLMTDDQGVSRVDARDRVIIGEMLDRISAAGERERALLAQMSMIWMASPATSYTMTEAQAVNHAALILDAVDKHLGSKP